MVTFMMKSRRSGNQGLLLLLSLLLLTFSAIPGPIRGDERITDGGRKSEMVMGKAAVIPDDDVFNGCWPHDAEASNFCCTKDNLNWPSLYECAINCPCKVMCDYTDKCKTSPPSKM